ncbi:mercury(II) reductase [Zhihengliuella alba]|uniref:Mercury(II) reductase n=1 Tax=Zhihengliuella alba TaxID=547018 RepID=A0ABP7CR06_9MICC
MGAAVSTASDYDLAVIGGGSAASAAAETARALGKTAVMIERGRAGGTCLNVGCVPSKMLLSAAEAHYSAGASRYPGVATSADAVDLEALVSWKDRFADERRQADHVDGPIAVGIDVLRGDARLLPGAVDAPVEIAVAGEDGTTRTASARSVVVATGAVPRIPQVAGLEDVDYLTSAEAMSLSEVPDSVLVVGGNAVGLEQAQWLSHLGAKVTVLQLPSRIAPQEQPEISVALKEALTEQGIEILEDADLFEVGKDGGAVVGTAMVAGVAREVHAERILIAAGREPATAGLGLEVIGVETGPRGEITVDDHLRTTHPRIWAAGDVTGAAQFVYVAGTEGAIAAENAVTGSSRSIDYAILPRVTFTSPQLASVGITTEQAAAEGIDVDVRELPLMAVPRAAINGESAGKAVLISDRRDGKVRGFHMVGDSAGDVVTAAAYAIAGGLTVEQIASLWAPFLTMSEALRITAQSAPRSASLLQEAAVTS